MAPLHKETVTEENKGVLNKWESNCSTSMEQERVSCELCTCGSSSEPSLEVVTEGWCYRTPYCGKSTKEQPGVLVYLTPKGPAGLEGRKQFLPPAPPPPTTRQALAIR
ncbi:hypothetical protein KIL84_003507 [Mauremys mutica]|uniref:Uncharacterized protein n=1 Tax=Mauremys mutica TaxID=74926 RepID=A0A9D3WPK3_9SAUR|nr:hypothetical protein KIL84_003507 [Mauremys mutica]